MMVSLEIAIAIVSLLAARPLEPKYVKSQRAFQIETLAGFTHALAAPPAGTLKAKSFPHF